MRYTTLLEEADKAGLVVKEIPLEYNDGRIKGNRIAIRKNIETTVKKACVLAEELGHYYTSTGDILDQRNLENRKQEHKARLWAFKKMVTLEKLMDACKAGCRNRYEVAEYMGVTEEFLQEALDKYRNIYGCGAHIKDYLIFFDPLRIYRVE